MGKAKTAPKAQAKLPVKRVQAPVTSFAGLTDQQGKLVSAIVDGVKPADSWMIAGYADQTAAWRALRLPHVLLAIRSELARVVGAELPALAVSVLRRILSDDDAADKDRLAAARLALEAGRVIGKADAQKNPLAPGEQKNVEDMSQAELEAFVRAGRERVQALRAARTVEAVPARDSNPAPGDAIPPKSPA